MARSIFRHRNSPDMRTFHTLPLTAIVPFLIVLDFSYLLLYKINRLYMYNLIYYILTVFVPLAMWAAEMTVKIAFGARQFVKINRYAFDCSVFFNFFDLHNIRFLIQFHTHLIVRRPHLHNPPQRSVYPNRIYKYRIVLFLQVVFPTFPQTL